jgi:membrane associated rhomboid family serine protease
MFNLTPIVKNILIINVLLFAVPAVAGFADVMIDFFGLRYPFAPSFSVYQIVTHMFIHGGFSHLLYNMFGLIVFGPMLETVWGSKRFLIFYMVCGLGASALYSGIHFVEIYSAQTAREVFITEPTAENYAGFLESNFPEYYSSQINFIEYFAKNNTNESIITEATKSVNTLMMRKINSPMVGASGAIFGILMAFGLLFPNTELMLLFPPIPVKAKYIVGFYGLTALFGALHKTPGDNVAHYAHLGGMLFALFFVLYWKKYSSRFY